MRNGKKVTVNVAKTWDLVCRHRIYSRPETHSDISNATLLDLESGLQNKTMKVVGFWKFNPACDEPPDTVPTGWRERLNDYIVDARHVDGILNLPGDYCFFGLANSGDDEYETRLCNPEGENSWPDWLLAIAQRGGLNVQAALAIWREKELFFCWPTKAELLWQVTRHEDRNRNDCYNYPENVKCRLGREPDGRNNGPAIHAFEMSGGNCPPSWHVHHIYDGRVLITGTSRRILHAVKDPDYFTHSGGLVAAHPAAHFVAHESELLGWILRWEAFRRLKFDPQNIFGGRK